MQQHRHVLESLKPLLLEMLATGSAEIPPPPPPPPDPIEEFVRFADGTRAIREAMTGGGSVREIPIAQAAVSPAVTRHKEYARAPRYGGIIVATVEFQAWRAQWRDACNRGEGDEWLLHSAPYRFPGDGGP
jgi:hypothetical protein